MVSYRHPGLRLQLVLENCFSLTLVLICTVVWNTEKGNCIRTRDCSGNSRVVKVTVAICTCILHQSYCISRRTQELLPALVGLSQPTLGLEHWAWGRGDNTAVFREGLWNVSGLAPTSLIGRGLTSKIHFVLVYRRRFSVFCWRPSSTLQTES